MIPIKDKYKLIQYMIAKEFDWCSVAILNH